MGTLSKVSKLDRKVGRCESSCENLSKTKLLHFHYDLPERHTHIRHTHAHTNTPNRTHSGAVLLDFDLLELDEFGTSRLKEEFATRFVGGAVGGWTL